MILYFPAGCPPERYDYPIPSDHYRPHSGSHCFQTDRAAPADRDEPRVEPVGKKKMEPERKSSQWRREKLLWFFLTKGSPSLHSQDYMVAKVNCKLRKILPTKNSLL